MKTKVEFSKEEIATAVNLQYIEEIRAKLGLEDGEEIRIEIVALRKGDPVPIDDIVMQIVAQEKSPF